ncbi:eukaryotic translation initiation factor 4 gamma 3-like isoform X2 [Panonychus citri]|nr:eukaryotic translation initiation factor 4 gamma 3-like isoform X2 [Panonychus citri]
MNDLDVRIESDQLTKSTVTPEPTEDSSNSSSTTSSNTVSSKQVVIESKSPKAGSEKKVEEKTNDLDARTESDQLTISAGVTPEPTEDSSNSSSTNSSTTHSSKQAVIESKSELKSVESTTQVSPVSEEIPNSNEISSSSEIKDASLEETRPVPIDVVDHASVMTREESISPQDDFKQSKEVPETSVDQVSPSETKEENKENDKPAAADHPKINAKGKYEYEAEFLRSLQSHPLSLKKPNLPDLDIVQQVPITQREKQTNRVNDFLPSYMAPSRNNRSLPVRISGRNSRELRPSKPPIKIIPSPSLNQDVSLHTVENAWKPAIPALAPVENIDEEEKKTQELLKRFRGILNKLTPQKYDDLIRQVDALSIDSADRLNKVLELIFDKAVDEPAFCTDYAKLCKHISLAEKAKKSNDDKDKSSEKDDKTKEKQFRGLLLTKCQNEFESDIYKDVNIEERLQEIETISDPEKKKIAKLELDEDKRKARKRTLGIIKFIGELYMFDMLRVAIMDSCIAKLLKASDDESLELLCTLLRTVGAKWEQDSAKKPPIQGSAILYWFNMLREIVQKRLTSSRVRFMIQDVLDMKQAGWKVRKIQAENKPKTIEQLHAEIQQEEQNKKHEIAQHIIKTGDVRKPPSKQEEWNTNSQRNRTNTPKVLETLQDLKKMNLSTSQADTISLLPQRGMWGSGASLGAGTSQRSQPNSDIFSRNSLNERDKNPRNSGNMGRDSMEGRVQSSGTSFRPFSSMEGEPHSGYPGRASMGNRVPSTMAPFASTSDASVKKETSSRSNSMEKSGLSDSRASSNNSTSNLVRESPKKEVAQVGSKLKGNKELSDAKVSEKAQNCVKEFMHHGIKEDAKEDLLELCTEKNVHLYVESAINLSLDLSSQPRLVVGELLGYLVKEKTIKPEYFFKGLHCILEIAADIIIDIPLLWNNLAEVLVPLFCSLESSNRKKFFTKALEPIKEDEAGGALLIMYHILNFKKNNPTSPYDCASAWIAGSLEWSSFLPSKEKSPEEFFKKLDLTMPVFDLQLKLEPLSNFVKSHSVSQLSEYISSKFTPEEVKEAKFVRALTEAVVNRCVVQNNNGGGTNVSYKLNSKLFANYCPILAKFHGGDKNLEIEIITTTQILVGEYVNPKGLVTDLFDNLYRKASISVQAFIDWEQDTMRLKNKGAAVLMVKDFLTKLKEGGSGSDS